MVIDSNAREESSAPTPNANMSQPVGRNGIVKSPVCQKDTMHQNATTAEASNTFEYSQLQKQMQIPWIPLLGITT